MSGLRGSGRGRAVDEELGGQGGGRATLRCGPPAEFVHAFRRESPSELRREILSPVLRHLLGLGGHRLAPGHARPVIHVVVSFGGVAGGMGRQSPV